MNTNYDFSEAADDAFVQGKDEKAVAEYPRACDTCGIIAKRKTELDSHYCNPDRMDKENPNCTCEHKSSDHNNGDNCSWCTCEEMEELTACLCRKCGNELLCEHNKDEVHILSLCGECV